ncbi:MAG: hypothetical protein ABIK09_12935 [Pseudomonadota bacterium]
MQRIVAIIGVLLGMAWAGEGEVSAQWGPGQIAVQGELSNLAGEPVVGPVNLAFALYPSITADAPVWSESHPGVPLDQGVFDLILGDTAPLDDPPLFEVHPDLWVGVSVNGAEELPRVPLVSVGYSMQAKHAAVADSLSQPPTDLECDGCVGFGDLSAQGCVGDDLLKRNPGNTAWVCGADQAVTEDVVDGYVADNGFALAADLAAVAGSGQFGDLVDVPAGLSDGDDDTLAGLSCIDGMILRRSNGVWGCALPLLEGEVDAAVANNGYAMVADLSTVAMSGQFSDLLSVPEDLADGDDTGLSGTGAAGELARFVEDGSLAGAALFQDGSGRIGAGNTSPAVRLDVTGEVRLGNSGVECTAATEGSIRYVAAQKTFEGCDGTSWKPLSWFDATPDAFDFADVADASLNTAVVSNIVQLTGFTKNLLTLLTGEGSPQMRVCADGGCSNVLITWTVGPVTVSPDQHLQLRLTSSTDGDTARTATVTVGDVQDIWSVTTSVVSWRIGTWNGVPIYGVQTCPSGDWYCQAQSACEQATGATCVWQSYNCSSYPNENGSFYPTSNPLGRSVSTGGSSELNWTVTSGCAASGAGCDHGSGTVYGNLCCCNCNTPSQQWNEGNNYCGVGIWEPY